MYLRVGRRPDLKKDFSAKTAQNHGFLLKLDGKIAYFFRLRRATTVIDLTQICFVYLEWIRRVAWKKLVILSNSTPVATWTLSSWRDFRNKFHGFSTVFVAYNVCSVVFCLCLFVLSRLIVFVLYFVNACTFYVWDFSWSFVTHFFIIPSLISVCIIRYVMSLQRQTE